MPHLPHAWRARLVAASLVLGVAGAAATSGPAEAAPAFESLGPGEAAVVEHSLRAWPDTEWSTVVGTVENRGDTTLGSATVSVDQWDSAGNLLASRSADVAHWSRIDPGQRAGFLVPLEPIAGFDHYTVRSWGGTASTPANRRFTAAVAHVDARTVGGTYRNDNASTIGRVGVTAIFQDASGHVVDIAYDTRDLGTSYALGAGETGNFSVTRSSGIWVDPVTPHTTATMIVESLDAPSPLPLETGLYTGAPLRFGSKLLMSGWMHKKHTDGEAEGVVAILEGRRVGTSAWTVLGRDTSDAVGNIAFYTAGRVDGVFDYRVRVPATATREAAMSPVVRPKVQWLIELSGPATPAKTGRSVGLSVTSNGLGRTKVTLERQQGKRWVRVDTTPINRKGRASFTTDVAKGSNKFRVTVPKHGEHDKLTSRVLIVRAR